MARSKFCSIMVVMICLSMILSSCTIVKEPIQSNNYSNGLGYIPVTPAMKDQADQNSDTASNTEPTPVPTPTPTPEPTPEPTPVITEVKLSNESYDEIISLASNPNLIYVDGTASKEYDAMLELSKRLPDCKVKYNYTINFIEFSSLDEEITVYSMDGLLDGLKYLPYLKQVDMTAFQVNTNDIDTLQAIYPDVFFLFYVRVIGFDIRTDITCFSTLCSPDEEGGEHFWTPDLEPLFKYCRKLVALDMGHNKLTDISEMSNLKDLKVLILGDNQRITDLSPLGALKNLEYLELFTVVRAKDFEVLKELPNIKYLNVSNAPTLLSMDFINYMPKLEKLWIYNNRIYQSEIDKAIEDHPEIEIRYRCDFWGPSVTCCGWRAFDYNVAIRNAFTNWMRVIKFNNWDDVVYEDCELRLWVPTLEH